MLADCDPADKLAADRAGIRERRDDHGRRRRQRRACARRRRCRGGACRPGRDRVLRGRRRRAHCRPDRRAWPTRSCIARRSKGIALQAVLIGMGLSLRRHGRRRRRAAAPRGRRGRAGDHRRAGHRHRVAGGAARAGPRLAMPAEDSRPRSRCGPNTTRSSRWSSRSAPSPTRCPPSDGDLAPVRALLARLEGELLPHERADERALVPLVDRALGGPTHRRDEPHARRDRTPGRPGCTGCSAGPDGHTRQDPRT